MLVPNILYKMLGCILKDCHFFVSAKKWHKKPRRPELRSLINCNARAKQVNSCLRHSNSTCFVVLSQTLIIRYVRVCNFCLCLTEWANNVSETVTKRLLFDRREFSRLGRTLQLFSECSYSTRSFFVVLSLRSKKVPI